MSNPLFAPESTYWRVNREWLIALAGPRAVLLELAHPAVAAGVAQHSDYRGDPFGRLYRTMKTMTAISFGTESEVRAALKHFHKCHARVHSAGAGCATSDGVAASAGHTAGSCIVYDARDPHLQLWVWATLVDSVLRVHDRFVTPLSFYAKGAYYDDCVRLAQFLGVSAEVIPSSYSSFNRYMGMMLDGDALHVTQESREVVNALFAPTLRGNLTRWFSSVGIEMLPARLREEYGLTWDERGARRVERLAFLSRRVRPWVPTALAIHPKAWMQERRLKMGYAVRS